MRNSRLMLTGASVVISSSLIRFVINMVFDGIYSVPSGWGTKLALLIWSVAIVRASEVNRKWSYVAAGTGLYVIVGFVLIFLSMFDLILPP